MATGGFVLATKSQKYQPERPEIAEPEARALEGGRAVDEVLIGTNPHKGSSTLAVLRVT
jgi:hypothetical protein